MSTTNNTPPTSDELAGMTQEERARLGASLDGTDLVEYGPRHDEDSPASKRAERQTAKWFFLSALAALAFVVIFIAWPWQYRPPLAEDEWVYALYTPLLGATLGAAILFIGFGVMSIALRIAPHEVSVQQRHVGGSAEHDKQTLGAEVMDTLDKTGLKSRRGVLKGSLLLAGGGLATAALIAPIGGLIKDPWDEDDENSLWVTDWDPTLNAGKPVHLTSADGAYVRPSDLSVGSMMTVFPGVPGGAFAADSAVMLFRLRPDEPILIRGGQESFHYGTYFAYSKVCTHVGCPVSLYEDQTGRVLCPCHQSQFDVHNGMRPVFGPATRPLPELPITVDDDGYFVATGDFIEPVGPGFWLSDQGSKPWSSHPMEENS